MSNCFSPVQSAVRSRFKPGRSHSAPAINTPATSRDQFSTHESGHRSSLVAR
jgi:hypothetical protein